MTPQPNWIDKLAGYVSPRWAAERTYYRRALEMSYRGGLQTRTSNAWPSSQSSIGSLTLSSSTQRSLRDRARNLDRNNALASSVLDRSVENVIGTGIRVEPRTGVKSFDDQVRDLWKHWCDYCDIQGLLSFNEMQALALRSELRDGDIGVVLVDRGGDLRLQAIEGDYIATPLGKMMDPLMEEGVEKNSVGRPVAFWVRTVDQKLKDTYTRVTENNMILLARRDRFSTVRGASAFAQGFELFDHISGYLEGTVISAKAASYFSLLIRRINAAGVFGNLGTTTNSDGDAQRKLKLEPGSIQYLQPDEDVVQLTPNQPTQNFPDAIAAFARFVGLKFGLTIEQVLLDFSRANYSSSRAARLQAQQTAEMEQQSFARKFVSRVYQWRVARWCKDGTITGEIPENNWDHEWIPQGRPWVDPTKEIEAASRAIDLGIETRSNIALERGYDFAELCERNEMDRELMDEHELPLVLSNASQIEGQPATTDPNQPNNETPNGQEDPNAPTDGNNDPNQPEPGSAQPDNGN